MVDLLLNGLLCDEAVNCNVTLLSDTECSFRRLQVDHWIPIRVKDDHFVSRRQVYTKTSYPSCQQEDSQAVRGLFVLQIGKALDQVHAKLDFNITVQAQEWYAFAGEY